METREDILKELKQVAPQLALVDKVNLYTVPANYFVDFKQVVFDTIKFGEAGAELNAVAPQLAAVNKAINTDMPSAYFNNFSEGLLKKIKANEAANELVSIAPTLAKFKKVNALEVPANYFNALPALILSQIRPAQSVVEAASPKWIQSLDAVLEKVISVVFKPTYAVAFAGLATTLIIGGMMLVKVEQCDDIDCKLASLSNEEINTYLDKRPDIFTDEVFESVIDEEILPAGDKAETVHGLKDALKDIDDAALEAAITD